MAKHVTLAVMTVLLAGWLPTATADDATTKPTGKCMMWTAKSKTTTVYLVGSIHAGKPEMYPLPKEMEDAFAKAGLLVEEVRPEKDDGNAFGEEFWHKTQYTGDDTLPKHMTPEQWKDVKDACELVGVPPEAAETSKPGMVCLMLGFQSIRKGALHDYEAIKRGGLAYPLGIDKHFEDEATARKLPIEGLETAEFQSDSCLKWIDQITVEQLVRVVSRMKTERQATTQPAEGKGDEDVRWWLAGDAEAEARSLRQSARRRANGINLDLYLLDERNAKMTEKIEQYLKGDKTVFVVVGCAHVVGDQGIVQMLQDDGFDVQQSSATKSDKSK
jgi:uncharacterized protein YbaP (TraB family)